MDIELKYKQQNLSDKPKARKVKNLFITRAKPHNGLETEEQQIIEAALAAKDEWVEAGNDFNYAQDDLLLDYHIYRLKACESRYIYFLKLAKEKGITLSM